MKKIGLYKPENVSETELKELIQNFKESHLDISSNLNDADIIITFSDHDLLTLAQENGLLNMPVLVVETKGDHSFFAQFTTTESGKLGKVITEQLYHIEDRMMLKVSFNEQEYLALNDVYIASSHQNSRMRYDLLVDNSSIFDNADSANAILLCTPTGSTAMAFNLGGALIHHSANVIQVLTIASRNQFNRNHIISALTNITVEILDTQFPLFIQVDSNKISTETNFVKITKADQTFALLIVDIPRESMSLQEKLTIKLSYEDTKDLTASAKFVLHVLQQQNSGMTVAQIMEITHINNQKTLRSSLNLLLEKGLISRRDNLEDLREHIYSFSKI